MMGMAKGRSLDFTQGGRRRKAGWSGDGVWEDIVVIVLVLMIVL